MIPRISSALNHEVLIPECECCEMDETYDHIVWPFLDSAHPFYGPVYHGEIHDHEDFYAYLITTGQE